MYFFKCFAEANYVMEAHGNCPMSPALNLALLPVHAKLQQNNSTLINDNKIQLLYTIIC